MNRLVAYGVGVSAALVVVIGGTLAVHHDTHSKKPNDMQAADTSNSTNTSPSTNNTGKKSQVACGLLTKTEAQISLGETAKASTSNGLTDTENKDAKVTQCTYIMEGNTPEDHAEASLMVRLAKTTLGARANQTAFGSERPKGTITVKGYGDAAYWSQSKGELNILKANNWYVVSILHDTSPSKTKLSEVEQLAKHILQQL